MSQTPTTTSTNLQSEVERLEREVKRERAARQESESIAERSLRNLYDEKERLELLQALLAAANAADTIHEAKAEAVTLICRHTDWPIGHVYRHHGGQLVPTEIWSEGVAGDERFQGWREATAATVFAAGEGLPGRVLATGRPAWVRDVAEEPNFVRAAAAAELGLHGALAFPVLLGTEVEAVLEFFSDRPEEPVEPLLELMAYAGIQLGYVVERQQLRSKHALILDAAGEGIYGLDTKGRTTFVNEAAAEMIGWATVALIGQQQHDVLHHHHADGTAYTAESCPIYRTLRDGQERRVMGEVFWRRDGTSFPVEYVATPLREGEVIVGAVVVFRDVSEEQAAAAALRSSEAQLREAQRLASLGSWHWDVASGGIMWSDELFRIFGYKPGGVEVTFERYREHIHPEDRAMIQANIERSLVAHESYEALHRVVRKDGAVRWIQSLGQPILDGGKAVALQGTAQDVTERVEAEAALRRYAGDLERAEAEVRANAEFFQSALDALTAHVAVLDEETYVMAVNEAWRDFARANAYEGDDFGVGTSYLEVCETALNATGAAYDIPEEAPLGTPDGSIAAQVAERLRALLAGEVEQFSIEYPFDSPSERRWFQLRATRFVGPDGIRLVTAHENITAMKNAEAALLLHTEELEERNEELQKFAYVASHDLQEPLRMVTSFLQLLERRYGEHLDEAAREYIGYAVDGARRMQRLIQDLLAYSRVGTRSGDFEPVDTNEILLDVLHDLGPAIQDAGAEVEIGMLPVVRGDATQLHQLFQNLVGNALKFRSADVTPHVSVAAKPAMTGDEGRSGWRFTVTDNGIGIDAEYAERIFQVFQRLHTREEYEGTGIGLAICRKIVERHGGSINVVSTPGAGSTFTFILPASVTTS